MKLNSRQGFPIKRSIFEPCLQLVLPDLVEAAECPQAQDGVGNRVPVLGNISSHLEKKVGVKRSFPHNCISHAVFPPKKKKYNQLPRSSSRTSRWWPWRGSSSRRRSPYRQQPFSLAEMYTGSGQWSSLLNRVAVGGRLTRGGGKILQGSLFRKAPLSHTLTFPACAHVETKKGKRERERGLHVERCVDHCSPCSDAEGLSVVYVHALICR